MDAAMRDLLGGGGCATGGVAAKGAVGKMVDGMLGPGAMMGPRPQVARPVVHPMREYLHGSSVAQHPRGMPVSAGEVAFMQQQNRNGAWAEQFQKQRGPAGMEAAWAARGHPRPMEAAWQQQQHPGFAAAIAAKQHQQMSAAWAVQQQQQQHFHELAWKEAQQRQTAHAWANEMREKQRSVPNLKAAEDDARTKAASGEVVRLLSETNDPKIKQSEFLKFMAQVNSGELQIKGNTVVSGDKSSLEAAWKDSATTQPRMDAAWSDSTNPMQEAWRQSRGSLDTAWSSNPEMAKLEETWKAAMGEESLQDIWQKSMQEASILENAWQQKPTAAYNFSKENKYLDTKNVFEEGLRLFDAGEIREAVLAFEACVKQQDDHSEGWRMLGHCHAEQDEDRKAIYCLEQSADRDPYNLQTLLALGVSYVNELNHERALKNLRAWVQNNPRFMGMEVVKDMYSDGSLMDEVLQLMLKAKQFSAGDPGVQEVLGVLYNVTKDYDHAVAAFKAAVGSKPDDYALWNKLGATLANSDRSKEAMPAYHRALELKPKYARGWLNLGIAHANVSSYAEAARCYLTAVALNPQAAHIWSYIRICFTCLGRNDLVAKTDKRDVRAFTSEYDIPFLDGTGSGKGARPNLSPVPAMPDIGPLPAASLSPQQTIDK